MIDNFEPQPYPLECSADGGEQWVLVVGWQKTGDGRLTPVLAIEAGGLAAVTDPSTLRYRSTGGNGQRRGQVVTPTMERAPRATREEREEREARRSS